MRRNTNLRIFKAAAHARWCGPSCPDTCNQWAWDEEEVRYGLVAVGVDPDAHPKDSTASGRTGSAES